MVSAQPNHLFDLAQSDWPRAESRPESLPQYTTEKLHLPEAHRLTSGARVRVALIDSQVDRSHPELVGTVVEQVDLTEASPSPHLHGTAMAGAIAAKLKLIGAAPAAEIIAITAFSPAARTARGEAFTLVRAVDRAIQARAKVINMSFAGPRNEYLERALGAAHERGLTLVSAVGNAGPRSPALYPAADPHVIAVTATDAEDAIFAGAVRGAHVALAAPGVDVVGSAPGEAYGLSTGTSIAAAQISGIAALLLAQRDTLEPDAIRRILTQTARDLGPPGRDDTFGAGLADAYGALLALEPQAAAAAPSR